MKYLSVCSGIEAATVAWHPLGWKPSAFSEIEKFPSRVLAHHYPDVPNLGDMTKYQEWPDAAIDLLVGGTPCQSFSVAGLRKGLDDPRGNLMLTYGAIAGRYRPRWLVWENVPGVLSSNGGRDFGTFLGMLAELGYGFAYRILDAQYIRVDGFARAVPQRRRRVFVVGYLGDWRRAAAVLFERESLCGHPAPSRKAGEGIARPIVRSLAIRGRDGTPQAELGEDVANAILTPSGGRAGIGVGAILQSSAWPAEVASTLNAAFGSKQGLEDQHALKGGGQLFVPAERIALPECGSDGQAGCGKRNADSYYRGRLRCRPFRYHADHQPSELHPPEVRRRLPSACCRDASAGDRLCAPGRRHPDHAWIRS